MCTLQAIFIVFVYVCNNLVKGDNGCEFSNIKFKDVVAGIEGKVNSSDPLYVDVIKGILPTLTYSLKNSTFTGLKDCEAIHVQCDKNKKNELIFQYYIQCPHLLVTMNYEADGKLEHLLIEGHGTTAVEMHDYVMMFDGTYENVIGADQIRRPVVKRYTLDTDPKGILKFNMKNLDHGDKEREALGNRFFNENWREMEKMMRSPVIKSFTDLLIENLNTYSKSQ